MAESENPDRPPTPGRNIERLFIPQPSTSATPPLVSLTRGLNIMTLKKPNGIIENSDDENTLCKETPSNIKHGKVERVNRRKNNSQSKDNPKKIKVIKNMIIRHADVDPSDRLTVMVEDVGIRYPVFISKKNLLKSKKRKYRTTLPTGRRVNFKLTKEGQIKVLFP